MTVPGHSGVRTALLVPAVSRERAIGEDLGPDYASVTIDMAVSTVINAMTVTNLNQMETCPHATFVEPVTQVKIAKLVQRDMQGKIARFVIRAGGNLDTLVRFIS